MNGKTGALLCSILSCLITMGVQERVLGIDRDITESKRAEEALRKNEAQLRAVSMPHPSPLPWSMFRATIFDFWSRSALTLFAIPRLPHWSGIKIAYPHPDYRRDAIDRWKVF